MTRVQQSPQGTDGTPEKRFQDFIRLWRQLSPHVQSQAFPRLVHEVVYDPNRSTIKVTLDADAVEQMVKAPPASA